MLLGRGRFRALLPRHGPATRPPSRSMPTRAAQPPPHAPAGPICASSARRTPAAVASDRLLQLPHAAAAAAQQPSRARRPADPRRQGPTVAYFRPQGGAQPHAQRAAAVAAAAMAAWRVPSERRVLDQDQVPDQATREATVRQPRRPGPRRTTTTAAQRAGRVAQSRGGAGRQPDGHARGPQVTLFISFCVSFVPRSGGRCPARRRSSPPSTLRSDGRSGGGPAGRFIIYYRFLRLYRAVALTRQRETRCVHRSPRASTVARARKRRR